MKKKGFTLLKMCKNLGNRLRLRNWSRSLLNVFRQRTQPYHVRRNEQRNLSTYDEKQVSPTGLTLIEILVVLFIMGFVTISLYYVLSAGIKGWREGKERTDIIAQARVAMDRLTREVREATYMVSASDTKLRFSAYLLGTAAADYKDISYYYDSDPNILYRHNVTDEAQAREMAYSVTTFDFDYYSKWADNTIHELDSPVANPLSIWMIAIDTQVTRGPTGEQNVVNLRSTVQPRNYSYPQ